MGNTDCDQELMFSEGHLNLHCWMSGTPNPGLGNYATTYLTTQTDLTNYVYSFKIHHYDSDPDAHGYPNWQDTVQFLKWHVRYNTEMDSIWIVYWPPTPDGKTHSVCITWPPPHESEIQIMEYSPVGGLNNGTQTVMEKFILDDGMVISTQVFSDSAGKTYVDVYANHKLVARWHSSIATGPHNGEHVTHGTVSMGAYTLGQYHANVYFDFLQLHSINDMGAPPFKNKTTPGWSFLQPGTAWGWW